MINFPNPYRHASNESNQTRDAWPTDVSTGSVTVTTTPTLLVSANELRASVTISNPSTQAVLIGTHPTVGSCVHSIPPNGAFTTAYQREIYAVVAATTGTATYWDETF